MKDWSLESLRSGTLRALVAYWDGIRGDRALPSRQDISPAEIPALLPSLLLIDVLGDAEDFRFRLVGTNFREVTGQEPTGKRIDEVFPSDLGAEKRRSWEQVVARRQPLACSGSLWIPGRDHVHWEGVAMPLSTDGDRVDMLLAGIVFSTRKPERSGDRSAARDGLTVPALSR